VLPANGSAIRASHASGNDAPSAALQTGNSQSGLRTNAATPNPKDLSTGTESGTSQNAQPQRTEADLSAAASVPALSPQLTAVPAAAPATAAAVTVPVSGAQAPVVSSLPQAAPAPTRPSPAKLVAPEAPALGAVQAAQLINRAGQSEMRVGLNTSAFGSVEVRTTVRTSDVGLVIGSEKGDLRTLLANDMPAITNALQQQNLRLNSVNFMQGFAFSNNASGGGGSEQRSFVPMRPSADSTSSEAAPENSTDAQPATRWGGASISILA
jgi:flagellar hook-length control protein FliK